MVLTTVLYCRNATTNYGSYRAVAGADSESERSGPEDHEDESEGELEHQRVSELAQIGTF